ncbi:MAG TPA: hypothetical protein VIY28_14975 [Pseudonocardiaceae bacterium]
MLCWARALGEFGATITFAGNFPGTTQTMPLAVYIALETDPDGAIVLSLVLLAVSIVVLACLALNEARATVAGSGGTLVVASSSQARRTCRVAHSPGRCHPDSQGSGS